MRHPSSTPLLHAGFLDRALPILVSDGRIAGVAATGSYAENAMDDFSDLDLILACEPGNHPSLMQDRAALAERLGPLVAAFTGEHVGEPRLMICLYGPPALHVDMKVVVLNDLACRVDEPVVLWERGNA
jgi:predicted nucleotidyltransferase